MVEGPAAATCCDVRRGRSAIAYGGTAAGMALEATWTWTWSRWWWRSLGGPGWSAGGAVAVAVLVLAGARWCLLVLAGLGAARSCWELLGATGGRRVCGRSAVREEVAAAAALAAANCAPPK
jgi:hypothetical protein